MRKLWTLVALLAAPAAATSTAGDHWTIVKEAAQCHVDRQSGVAILRLSAARDGQITLRMTGKGWKYVPDTLPYRATWYRFGDKKPDQDWDDLFLAQPIDDGTLVGVKNPMWESWQSQMTSAPSLTLMIESVSPDVTFSLAGASDGMPKLMACAAALPA